MNTMVKSTSIELIENSILVIYFSNQSGKISENEF